MDKGKKVVDGSEEQKGMKHWDEIEAWVMRDSPSKDQLFVYSKENNFQTPKKEGMKHWDEIEAWVMRDNPSRDQIYDYSDAKKREILAKYAGPISPSYWTNKERRMEESVRYDNKFGHFYDHYFLRSEYEVPDTPDQDPHPSYFGLPDHDLVDLARLPPGSKFIDTPRPKPCVPTKVNSPPNMGGDSLESQYDVDFFSEAVIDYCPQKYGFKRGLADSPGDFIVKRSPEAATPKPAKKRLFLGD